MAVAVLVPGQVDLEAQVLQVHLAEVPVPVNNKKHERNRGLHISSNKFLFIEIQKWEYDLKY